MFEVGAKSVIEKILPVVDNFERGLKALPEEEKESLMAEIPAGRMGQPDEVAALVLQLITGNEYLTGQVIQLDGGWI